MAGNDGLHRAVGGSLGELVQLRPTLLAVGLVRAMLPTSGRGHHLPMEAIHRGVHDGLARARRRAEPFDAHRLTDRNGLGHGVAACLVDHHGRPVLQDERTHVAERPDDIPSDLSGDVHSCAACRAGGESAAGTVGVVADGSTAGASARAEVAIIGTARASERTANERDR